MNPMLRDRQRASAGPRSCPMFVLLTTMSPEDGESMPPIRLSSVVLPLPDGPMRATKSPAVTSSDRPSRTGTSWVSRR